jgi:hypothetical protein
MRNLKPGHIIALIGSILVFLGVVFSVVVPFLLQQCKEKPEEPKELNLVITLRDADTRERIAGYVFINNNAIGTFIDSIETPPNIPLVQDRYNIRAESDGYVDVDVYIDHIGSPIDIPMRKVQIENGGRPPEPEFIPLPMSGWYPWDGVTITRGSTNNECIINNRGRLPDSAGIVNEHLGTTLRGRTLILCFSNTSASRFSEGRMAKLECDNLVLLSDNAFSIMGYLPEEDRSLPNGFEFKIPDTFNGKLNIVFYQAELNNLRITAYYR